MNKCDRCLRPLGDGDQTRRVEVQFHAPYGHAFRDERKIEGDVCAQCYQDVERTLTSALGVPTVYPSHVPNTISTISTSTTLGNARSGSTP